MAQRPEAPAGPGDGGRQAGARGWARVALAACLLIVVAAGLRVTVPAPGLDGPFRHDGLVVGVVLEAVLACLLAALLIRGARAPRDALIAAQLRKMLLYLVVAGLIAIPFGYALTRDVRPLRAVRPLKPKGAPPAHLHSSHPAGASAGVLIVAIILAVVFAAGLVYVVVYLLRNQAWLGFRRRGPGAAIEPAEGDEETELREAIESGQSALRRFDDAKAAIIACYVAMEESLAQAGTARAVADTPDELLARAAGLGLIRTGAASRLTALFYEARFSSHPMALAQRDQAQQALAELAGSLRDAEPAGTGGTAGSAGPAAASQAQRGGEA